MSDLDLYPAPNQPSRSFLRWIVLLFHGVVFALLLYFYPTLADSAAVLTSNMAHLVIPAWGGLLIVHLVVVALWDFYDGINRARTERRRNQEYQRMRKRRQLLSQFNSGQGARVPVEPANNDDQPLADPETDSTD